MGNVPQDRPIAIIFGNNGMERPNAEADYCNNAVKVPTCLIKMQIMDMEVDLVGMVWLLLYLV